MNRRPSLTKNMKRSGGAMLLALTMFSVPITFSCPIPPTVTPYCACCADPGEWSLGTGKIDDYQMKELNRLTLDGVANFYTTDAWPDGVSGVAAPDGYQDGYFVISIVREERDWKLFFKTLKSEKGALILTIPGMATFFDADIAQGPRPERKTTAELYKEIRLEGKIRGTGIFAKGIVLKTKYRLVVQGSGNRCLTAEDFYRWNLRVSGPRAEYTIYEYFAKPS